MQRRDLTKTIAFATFAALFADAAAGAKATCSSPCYPLTPSERVNGMAPSDARYPLGNILSWGADQTGLPDSTIAIQRAVNVAWASGSYGARSTSPCMKESRLASIPIAGASCSMSTWSGRSRLTAEAPCVPQRTLRMTRCGRLESVCLPAGVVGQGSDARHLRRPMTASSASGFRSERAGSRQSRPQLRGDRRGVYAGGFCSKATALPVQLRFRIGEPGAVGP